MTRWLLPIVAALPAFYLSYRFCEVLEAPLADGNRRWAEEAATIKTLEFLLVHAGMFIAGLKFTRLLWLRILGGCVLAGLYGSFMLPLAAPGLELVVLAVAALLAGRIFSAIRFGGGTTRLYAFSAVMVASYVMLGVLTTHQATSFGFTPEVVAALALPAPSPQTMMAGPAGAALFCAVWFFYTGFLEIARATVFPADGSSLRTRAITGSAGILAAVVLAGALHDAYDRTRHLQPADPPPAKPRTDPVVAAPPPDPPPAAAPITPRHAIKPHIDLFFPEYGGAIRPGDDVTFRGRDFGSNDGRRVVISQRGRSFELQVHEWSEREIKARIPRHPDLLPGAAALQIKGFVGAGDSVPVNVVLEPLPIEIREVHPATAKQGTEVTLRGLRFGTRTDARDQVEITTITGDRERSARALLQVVEWTDDTIRARLPVDARFVPGKYALVVVRLEPFARSNRIEIALD